MRRKIFVAVAQLSILNRQEIRVLTRRVWLKDILVCAEGEFERRCHVYMVNLNSDTPLL